jgi:hypothetical protein
LTGEKETLKMENETQVETAIVSPDTTPEAGKTPEQEGASTAPDTTPTTPEKPETIEELRAKLESERKHIKTLNAENAKRRKDADAAEQAALAEQGKFKELFEKSNTELEKLRSELAAKDRALLVEKTAQKFNLPTELRDRLRGDTAEELESDAKALAKFAVVKREAPASEAAATGNAVGVLDSGREEELKKRFRI